MVLRSQIVDLYGNGTYLFDNYENLPSYTMFLVMCRAFFEYIRLAFLPVNLRMEYTINPAQSLFSFKVLFPIIVLVSTLVAAARIKSGSGMKLVIFSVLWFFTALLPVSNIIPSGIVLAERTLYLPSVGSCLIMGLAVSKMQTVAAGRYMRYTAVSFVIILVMFAAISIKTNPSWLNQRQNDEDNLKLVRHRVEVFPGNPGSYIVLAGINIDLGEFGPEPEAALLKAKSLDPADPQIFYMLAKIYDKRSQPEKALAEITSAIKIKPEAFYYNFAGLILKKLKRYPEAAAMFDEAIRIKPAMSYYYVNMGNLLVESGNDKSAMIFFEKAAMLDPSNQDAYLGQGLVLNSQRKFDEAVVKLRKAVDLKPSSADLHYFLGVALKDAGRIEEAQIEFIESDRLGKSNVQ
jgi:tetratricopeptide (TPR) repeat protein